MVEQFNKVESVINEYKRAYRAKFGKDPVFNRNKVKYKILEVLKDLPLKTVLRMVKYFVKYDSEADINEFCMTYDDIYNDLVSYDSYKKQRQQLLEETEKRTKEFRERYGK